MSIGTAAAIPTGLRRSEIPLFANLANLAQTLEVFLEARGVNAAIEAAQRRSGRWFNPELVRAAVSLSESGNLWESLDEDDLNEKVLALEPADRRLTADDQTIDGICVAFAEIIDAKTPFTYQHSNGVADAAVAIGKHLGMNVHQVQTLRRAGLLPDIRKLGVSNAILEKPGKLTAEEIKAVRQHPYHTYEILRRVPALSPWTAPSSQTKFPPA
jgi:HD-GYP domain-containing protein (c-di-GMP phosphodiesterase class II)